MSENRTCQELRKRVQKFEPTDLNHKQTEEHLNLFKKVVASATDAIGISTPQGRHWYQNAAFDDLFGKIGEDPPASIYCDEKVGRKVFETIMAGGEWRGEVQMYATHGGVLDILLRAYAFANERGQILGLVGIHTDITATKRSRQLFEKVAQASTDVFYEWDVKTDSLTWFSDIAAQLGYAPDEVAPTIAGWIELIHPEDRPQLANAVEKHRTATVSIDYEYRVKHRDGTWRYWRDHATPVLDPQNRPVRWVGGISDVTEHKQAELKLMRVAQEWQATFDSANDAIWVLDTNQVVVRANKAAERYFQCSAEQMVGKHCWQVVHATQGPVPGCPMLKTHKSLGRERMELKVGKRWFEITVDPIFDASGQFYGAVHIVSDITDQKQTIMALQASEEKFRTLVEQSPLGISLIEKNGHYKYINPQFQEIFGYTMEDIPTGAAWFEKAFPDPHDRKHAREFWIKDLKQSAVGHSRPRDFWVNCKDGSRKEIQFIPVTLDNRDQFVIYEDITEKTILARQLQQAQKMEAIGTLAGGIAHDFNNMLSTILGRTELMLMDMPPEDPQRSDLQEIHSAASRSADLTRQLLAFARKQAISPKLLELNNSVETSLKMLRRLIGENIALRWQPDTNLWPVKIDPAQVDQILANLCINARDAITDTGKLTIETRNIVLDPSYCAAHAGFKPGKYVMLAVCDDGCGMDQETLQNAFEPFFTTKNVGKGTGLGLATVYGIVKQNHGFINIDSKPGMGTMIKIYLPPARGIVTEKQKTPVQIISMGSETVLVVEDEKSILSLTRKMLERYGYKVISACAPSQAIEMAKNHKGSIDLLLTDMVMPEMNGKELKRRIEQLEPSIKVLFMSGHAPSALFKRGVLESDVHLLKKPFSIKSLVNEVRNVLDENKDRSS